MRNLLAISLCAGLAACASGAASGVGGPLVEPNDQSSQELSGSGMNPSEGPTTSVPQEPAPSRTDGQPDERELEVRRRLALALVDESEYGRAWPHLEVVFAHGGDSWWLHLATAQVCLLWSMDYDCVQAHAERTLELRPNNARAHLYLAQVAQDRGDDDRAAAHYLAGLERRPDEIDMSMQLAALWASQGADDEAIAVLENALIFDRTNARLLLRLAALVEDRDETRAERLYQRALEYNDNPLGAARHLIRFYQRQGRSRDAERVRTWVEDQSARREMRPLR